MRQRADQLYGSWSSEKLGRSSILGAGHLRCKRIESNFGAIGGESWGSPTPQGWTIVGQTILAFACLFVPDTRSHRH
jgi:hypothetical protein